MRGGGRAGGGVAASTGAGGGAGSSESRTAHPAAAFAGTVALALLPAVS